MDCRFSPRQPKDGSSAKEKTSHEDCKAKENLDLGGATNVEDAVTRSRPL